MLGQHYGAQRIAAVVLATLERQRNGAGQLAARLLVQRVPQEVADQRRRRIRAEARDKGRTPNQDSLALAA